MAKNLEYYGDLVYKFKKLIGRNDFSFPFRKIITRYRRTGYNLNIMRQSACLGFLNPIMVDKKVQEVNDQEMAQSERDFHSINRGVVKT